MSRTPLSNPLRQAETLGAALSMVLGVGDRAGRDLLDVAGGRSFAFVCPEERSAQWLAPAVGGWAALEAVSQALRERGEAGGRDVILDSSSTFSSSSTLSTVTASWPLPLVVGPLRPLAPGPDPWNSFHEGAARFAVVFAIEGKAEGAATTAATTAESEWVRIHLPGEGPGRAVSWTRLEQALARQDGPVGVVSIQGPRDPAWRRALWRGVVQRLGPAPWASGAQAVRRLATAIADGRVGRRGVPPLHVGVRNLHQALAGVARTLSVIPGPVSAGVVSAQEQAAAERCAAQAGRGRDCCAAFLADLPTRSSSGLAQGLEEIACWAEGS